MYRSVFIGLRVQVWHASIITFSQCRSQVSDFAVHAAIRQPLAQDFVQVQVHMSKSTIMQHCQSLQQKQYSSTAATLTVFMQAIVWLGKHKRVHMLCSLRCMSHCHSSVEKKRKEKTTPFGVNLMRSQVYQAAQVTAVYRSDTNKLGSSPYRKVV